MFYGFSKKTNQQILLITNSDLSITYYFIRVIQYLISDGNIRKNSQYLCSASDNHVRALLDQKQYVSPKEEDEINDDTDTYDVEGNRITNQVEDLIKTLKSTKIGKLKDVPNDRIGELLRLLGILFRL